MGCGCEDGWRDSFTGVITDVIDKNRARNAVELIKSKIPENLYHDLLKQVESGKDDQFGILIKNKDGTMSVGCEVFPQTMEWAKARIGKPLHFVVTQLPKQGGTSMDVHEEGEHAEDEVRS